MSLLSKVSAVATFIALAHPATAGAGVIADENAKSPYAGRWQVADDGTAASDGVVDVYPAAWSIAPGDTLKLKVRSTTGYDVRILRLGWYGGAGSREVKVISGQAADPQPYPTSDPKFGLTEAKWHDSVSVPSDSTWTPGLYVARVEQSGGKQGEAIFAVRDDGLAAKLPILFVIPTASHQAYNAWPGPDRGGKSLYGFNSGTTHPTEAIDPLVQAVRVSFDRPFLVGGGTADIGNYEYPFLRWLEKNGWDVAYCTDQDLHANPGIALGRKVMMTAGHSEYWTRAMFDAAIAARDSGVNLLFASGDTISWQIRLEAGSGGALSTEIGYKENFIKDPEQRAAVNAKNAGKIDEAKAHFRNVTRGWKDLEYDTALGIDERHPGMIVTGVQSAGIIRDVKGSAKPDYPWADLVVTYPKFWLFDGTGMKVGDKITNVMGYEVDSCLIGTATADPFRPVGQTRLGTIVEISDGKPKGSVGYYQKTLGPDRRVEVLSLGAIAFSWALDDAASKAGYPKAPSSVSDQASTMMTNVFKRWTSADPIPAAPPPDGGVGDPDPTPPDSDGGVSPNPDGGAVNPAQPGSAAKGCACSHAGSSVEATDRLALILALSGLALVLLARIRRTPGNRTH